MLRTAQERWPLSELLVVPIPVQGEVAPIICGVLSRLAEHHEQLGLDAIVIARGGGSREDLPELTGINCVIFDEFHERSRNSELALALVREAQELLRPDLCLPKAHALASDRSDLQGL